MPPKTVLVVDGDEDHHRICAAYLPHLGYRVLNARAGPEGLRMAREHLPDLVVLDVLLPGMDGRRLFDALRADPATGRIPVLLVTAAVNWWALWGRDAAQPDGVVQKPCAPRDLGAIVQTLIGEP
jgi:two-component system cell cycle response regulator DivK